VLCACFFLHVSGAALKKGCVEFSKLWVKCLQKALRTNKAEDQEPREAKQNYLQQHRELRAKDDPIGLEEMVFGPRHQKGYVIDIYIYRVS
jgi:hypothetical protein